MNTLKTVNNLNLGERFNLSEVVVYNVNGERFVILARLAEALDVKKSDMYNVVARRAKEFKDSYVKTIKIQGTNYKRGDFSKCINLNGLNVIMEKLANSLGGDEVTNHIISYLNNKEFALVLNGGLTVSSEEINTTTDSVGIVSNVVEFKPVINATETIADEAYTIEEAAATNDVTIAETIVTDDAIDNDALGFLDGLSKIVAEHKEYSIRVPELEATIKSLEAQRDELLEKVNSINSSEIDALRKENERLQEKLNRAKNSIENMNAKANLIKNYVIGNLAQRNK